MGGLLLILTRGCERFIVNLRGDAVGGSLLILRGGCGRFIVNLKGRLWEVYC